MLWTLSGKAIWLAQIYAWQNTLYTASQQNANAWQIGIQQLLQIVYQHSNPTYWYSYYLEFNVKL